MKRKLVCICAILLAVTLTGMAVLAGEAPAGYKTYSDTYEYVLDQYNVHVDQYCLFINYMFYVITFSMDAAVVEQTAPMIEAVLSSFSL